MPSNVIFFQKSNTFTKDYTQNFPIHKNIKNIRLSTPLEKFYIQSPLHTFLINTSYKEGVFVQYSPVLFKYRQPKTTNIAKCTRYLHLEHYRPNNRTHINFPKNNISVCQGTVAILSKRDLK
jgi:hypothetical protein